MATTGLSSSRESQRQIVEVAQAFEEAHGRGLFTVLWCYLRNSEFVIDGKDFPRPRRGVLTAVMNNRAGGSGLISGRKALQRPLDEGVAMLNAIQDVYLSPEVTIA